MPPIELNYLRTAHAKHYALGDGKYQAVITVHPQHYQDENGDWQDCDNSLAVDGYDGFGWGQNKLPHRVRLKSDGTVRYYPKRNDLFSYLEFSVGALGGLIAPTVQGKSLVWDRPRFTVKISTTSRKIKFSATLKDVANKIQNPTLNFPLNLVGLTFADGALLKDGVIVAWLETPTAMDANGLERPLTWAYNGATNTLSLSLDTTGLVYPIQIDPTFTDQDATARDSYINSSSATQNFGSIALILAYNNINRVYLIGFDLSPIPASATCDSATLDLWTETSFAATTEILNLMVTEDWVELECTWQLRSTGVGWVGGTVFTTSDYSTELASMSVSAAAAGEQKTFTLLASAMQGQFNNATFSLVGRHTGFVTSQYRSSDTTSTGQEPLLTIIYTLAGGGPPLGSLSLLGVGR